MRNEINIDELKQRLAKRQGERDEARRVLSAALKTDEELKVRMLCLERAEVVIQSVAKQTQQELEYHVAELVSLALSAVYKDPYKMHLDFEIKRGKSEATLTFSRGGGEKVDPMASSGGGTVDLAAFALRVSLWSLPPKQSRSRALLVLDEPFRNIQRDLQPRVCALLKDVSKRLGLQMIIVTHETELLSVADRVFRVSKRKGVSVVERQEASNETIDGVGKAS